MGEQGNKQKKKVNFSYHLLTRIVPISTSFQFPKPLLSRQSPWLPRAAAESLSYTPACSVSASSQDRVLQTPAFNLSKGSSVSETHCANLLYLMGVLGLALKY